MMKVQVTKRMPGSPDGVTVTMYEAGETYEMPDELGVVFVRERWGDPVNEEPMKTPEEKPEEKPEEQPDGDSDTRSAGDRKKAKGPSENK